MNEDLFEVHLSGDEKFDQEGDGLPPSRPMFGDGTKPGVSRQPIVIRIVDISEFDDDETFVRIVDAKILVDNLYRFLPQGGDHRLCG